MERNAWTLRCVNSVRIRRDPTTQPPLRSGGRFAGSGPPMDLLLGPLEMGAG
ncbi:MAG: hypothetical protein VCF25_06200 [Candidatus Poribacteria bacterium]